MAVTVSLCFESYTAKDEGSRTALFLKAYFYLNFSVKDYLRFGSENLLKYSGILFFWSPDQLFVGL